MSAETSRFGLTTEKLWTKAKRNVALRFILTCGLLLALGTAAFLPSRTDSWSHRRDIVDGPQPDVLVRGSKEEPFLCIFLP